MLELRVLNFVRFSPNHLPVVTTDALAATDLIVASVYWWRRRQTFASRPLLFTTRPAITDRPRTRHPARQPGSCQINYK